MTWQLQNKQFEVSLFTSMDPLDSLQKFAKSGEFDYLLVHADDGVIWGKVKNNTILLSSEYFSWVSPPYREKTLQQARMFGESGEVFLWRDDRDFLAENYNNEVDEYPVCWRGREVKDHDSDEGVAFDEFMILWGTTVEDKSEDDEFTLLVEGRRGIRHAPPINSVNFTSHSLRLVVRHYLKYDEAGAAYIKISRLVSLKTGDES